MTRLGEWLARFRRKAHIGWGGDPVDPWLPTWQPNPGLEIR